MKAAPEEASAKPGKRRRKLAEMRQLRRRRHYPWSAEVTRGFPVYADLMHEAITEARRRYRWVGRAHMLWFRIGGAAELVLSISFPFVVALLSDDEGVMTKQDQRVVTGISVGIALLGSISAFYGWNDNWRLNRTQQLVLKRIIGSWELDILEVLIDPDPDRGRAHAVTKQAVQDLDVAFEHEQDVFFGSIRLPEDLQGRGKAGDQSP
ncbi:hypothetical protein ACFWMR_33080 [Amycolatopsis thailandensis]|uniref:hypothetical protein n=1 Tax=Amycolatopsis thailandensis TaxID=589330 RepID=UPI003651F963